MTVVAFDPSKHPRHPAGSPGSTGGEFARRGEGDQSLDPDYKVLENLTWPGYSAFPPGEFDPDGPVKFWPNKIGRGIGIGSSSGGAAWKAWMDPKSGKELAFWFVGDMGSPHHLDMANALGITPPNLDEVLVGPLRVSGYGEKPDMGWMTSYFANDLGVNRAELQRLEGTGNKLHSLIMDSVGEIPRRHRKDIKDANIMSITPAMAASGLLDDERLLKAVARLQRQYEKVYRRAARRAAVDYKAASVVVQAAGGPLPEEVVKAAALVESFLRLTGVARRELLREILNALLIIYGLNAEERAAELKAIAEYSKLLEQQVGVQAERLVAGVQDAAANVMLDSLHEGWSIPQTAKALTEKIDGIAPWQATMLARTDLIALANGASQQRAVVVNSPELQFKTWLATPDERTRMDHRHAHGQTVPIAQPFTVGGEQLLYPGDPSASDGNVINCRCTLIYGKDAFGPPGIKQIVMKGDLAMAAAAWDESKHPRHPAGDDRGGQFAARLEARLGKQVGYGETDTGGGFPTHYQTADFLTKIDAGLQTFADGREYVVLSDISVTPRGQGGGTKAMEVIKEFADDHGLGVLVHRADTEWYDRFPWLKKVQIGQGIYEYRYEPELRAAAWDETKHPRHPSGSEAGGEFRKGTISGDIRSGLGEYLKKKGVYDPWATADRILPLGKPYFVTEIHPLRTNVKYGSVTSFKADATVRHPGTVANPFTGQDEPAEFGGDFFVTIEYKAPLPRKAGGAMPKTKTTITEKKREERATHKTGPSGLSAGAFDESKHPRHPSGSERGGEFAPKSDVRGVRLLQEIDRQRKERAEQAARTEPEYDQRLRGMWGADDDEYIFDPDDPYHVPPVWKAIRYDDGTWKFWITNRQGMPHHDVVNRRLGRGWTEGELFSGMAQQGMNDPELREILLKYRRKILDAAERATGQPMAATGWVEVELRDEDILGILTAAGWDPAKHPRHPAGSPEGGEFAPKGFYHGAMIARDPDDKAIGYQAFRMDRDVPGKHEGRTLAGPVRETYQEAAEDARQAQDAESGAENAAGAQVDWSEAEKEFRNWSEALRPYYTEAEGYPAGYFENLQAEAWSTYQGWVDRELPKLQARLNGAQVPGLKITPQLNPQHDGDMDVALDPERAADSGPDFEVTLPAAEGGMEPAFTVWTYPEGANKRHETDEDWFEQPEGVQVEEVLDITDTDFFPDGPDSDLAGDYARAVDAARGVPDEPGFVTIYRGMSDTEYDAWLEGNEIPLGKWFAGIPTAQFAQDINREPPTLRSFRIPRHMLMQTGEYEFQLKKKGRMRNGTIEPSDAVRASGLEEALLTLAEALNAAGFNPALHPRHPKGSEKGGEFASKTEVLAPPRGDEYTKLYHEIEAWPEGTPRSYALEALGYAGGWSSAKLHVTRRDGRLTGVGVTIKPGSKNELYGPYAGAIEGSGLDVFRAMIKTAADSNMGMHWSADGPPRTAELYRKLGIRETSVPNPARPRDAPEFAVSAEEAKALAKDLRALAREKRALAAAADVEWPLDWWIGSPAVEMQAAAFVEAKHPRHPKGAPASRGGEFAPKGAMQVGERQSLKDKIIPPIDDHPALEAIDLIDNVLDYPTVPGEPHLPIFIDENRRKPSNQGVYVRDEQTHKPDLISVDPLGKNPVSSLTHELGHYLDHLLGQDGWTDPKFSGSEIEREVWFDFASLAYGGGALAPVLTAIKETDMYRGLVEGSQGAEFQYGGRWFRPGPAHVQYTLKPEELIARSFEQYIAAKNPGSTLHRTQRHIFSLGGGLPPEYPGYLKGQDLERVIAAWDRSLSDRGLLKLPPGIPVHDQPAILEQAMAEATREAQERTRKRHQMQTS